MHWFGSQRLLIDRLEFLVGKSTQTVHVAIDEIQRKTDAGRFMKDLYDMRLPYKFILSGSGSLELKEQIAESMMGRKRGFFIAPVSFAEFVDYRTDYAYSDRLASYGQMEPQRLAGHLAEYLNYGGYPRVIVSPTPYFVDLGLRNLVLNKWGTLTEPSDFGFVVGPAKPRQPA
jgi:predicted AAA+ superfamily ATPase